MLAKGKLPLRSDERLDGSAAIVVLCFLHVVCGVVSEPFGGHPRLG